MIDNPKWFSDQRTTEWIVAKAKELETAINAELTERAPKHSHLTYDALLSEVVGKHLNAFWSYEEMRSIGSAPQIRITRYNGEVDES